MRETDTVRSINSLIADLELDGDVPEAAQRMLLETAANTAAGLRIRELEAALDKRAAEERHVLKMAHEWRDRAEKAEAEAEKWKRRFEWQNHTLKGVDTYHGGGCVAFSYDNPDRVRIEWAAETPEDAIDKAIAAEEEA